MLNRVGSFLYGFACYLVFAGTFVYAIGFIGNVFVPKSIDSAPQTPLWNAISVDAVLLALFAIQHSVMARPWFKRAITRVIAPSIERSTYVLLSSLSLLLLFWKWQPMGGTLWNVENSPAQLLIEGLYALGWLTVLAATFLIDHFDLFGLRQVWLRLLGRPYVAISFRTPGLYRYVRHPLYVGWLIVFWSTPVMTSAHLFFAIATTAYILIAIQFEERDLRQSHPEYADYARRVPSLLPRRPAQQPSAGSRHAIGQAGVKI